MKAVLLAAAIVVACACSVPAQNLLPDYNWEVGINGGWSGFTRPLGPAALYQGTSTKSSGDFSLRLEYSASPHWLFNLDIGECRWHSYGNWTPYNSQGTTLEPYSVEFLIADRAIDQSVSANYVIPFYARYTNYNKANIYFGVSFGMMETVNDASIAYHNYGGKTADSSVVVVSRFDYGPGFGYNFGAQMGYTWYLIPRLGFNIDLAARFAHINTSDERYGSENTKYYLLYFPETIGIRWRF